MWLTEGEVRFFSIAKRSVAEVRSLLRFAKQRRILSERNFTGLEGDLDRTGKMLYYLIDSLRKQDW